MDISAVPDFNPADCYWLADDGRIYGTHAGALVESGDGNLSAWKKAGHTVRRWPEDDAGTQTDAALQALLSAYGLGVSGFQAVPASVSSAQAKIQLRRAGIRDKVDAAIQAADGEVQDWFTDARVWERNNQHVVDIGTSLGLKPADIDALFEAAAQISV